MKRYYLILLPVCLALIVWFYPRKKTTFESQPAVFIANEQAQPVSQQSETNFAATAINYSNVEQRLPLQTNLSSRELFNAVAATNLTQWKAALPGIQRLNPSDIEESWILEERDPSKYPSVLLVGANGQNINYVTSFIDVQITKSGDHIRRVELQAPRMTINETRALGLRLCDLLELDPKDFMTWYDRVGNTWVDKPTFSSKAGVSPVPSKVAGYTVDATFNNEKPWYITFILSDR